MFRGASSFNQPLDSWDVSYVYQTFCMFQDAYSFNQDLNSWDVSKVDKWDDDMYDMFKGASSFDKKNAIWYDFN